jgi:uncharacterized SAM-binding protein YcdF (DUF218 family)
LPLAFTGGMGWAAPAIHNRIRKPQVAARVAKQDYGITLRWSESQSRDTAGNARLLAPLLQRDGVQRIALVTDAWHMPRAAAAFEKAGLIVTPAPMGYVLPVQQRPAGVDALRARPARVPQVLHEWLALAVWFMAHLNPSPAAKPAQGFTAGLPFGLRRPGGPGVAYGALC